MSADERATAQAQWRNRGCDVLVQRPPSIRDFVASSDAEEHVRMSCAPFFDGLSSMTCHFAFCVVDDLEKSFDSAP